MRKHVFFAALLTEVLAFAFLSWWNWPLVQKWWFQEVDAVQTIPKVINYQARITDSAGVPVADGALNVKFAIYDAASGGTCLYVARGSCGTPTSKSVTVSNGNFSTLIGEAGDNAIPDNLFDNNTLYLGLTVGTDAEMSPRKRIGASGYAFNADRLDNLDTSATGGSQAYVPVTDSSGNLIITGKVGLGNASPSFTLDASSTTGIRVVGPSTTGLTFKSNIASSDFMGIRWRNSADAVRWSMGNDFNGNTNQDFWLYDNVNGKTVLLADQSGTGYLSFGTTQGGFQYDNTSKDLTWFVNGSNKLDLNSAGNLGIGDLTPAALLTVGNGDLFQVDTAGNLVRINNVGYSWPSSQGGAGSVLTNSGSGTLTWSASGATTNLNQAYINATGTPQISLNGTNGLLRISDTVGGLGTDLLEITDRTAANAYTTKYFTVSATAVGIGVASPSGRLSVNDTTAGSTNGATLLTLGEPITPADLDWSLGTGERIAIINGGPSGGCCNYGDLVLANSNASPAAGNSLGNVVFGAKSPGSIDTFTGLKAGINAVLEGSGGASGGFGGALTFGTRKDNAAYAERMRINNAGNVGIGNTNPTHTLDVSGAGSGAPVVLFNSTDTSGNSATLYLNNSGGGFGLPVMSLGRNGTLIGDVIGYDTDAFGLVNGINLSAASGRGIGFRVGGSTEAARFNSSGNFGIGTTNPTNKLDIKGSGASFYPILLESTSNQQIGMAIKNTGREWLMGQDGLNSGADDFFIYDLTATAFRFNITSTGNVGISNNTPTARLVVADGLASPTGNIFQVTNANDSARYMTVSSTGTTVTNLTVTGTCTGCGGGSSTLQGAYNSSTSPELTLDATRGALTIRDAASTVGNLLEIQDNANTSSYFTVSSTGVGIGNASPVRSLDVVGPNATDGAQKSEVIISDNAAYNASPVAGILFGTRYTSAGAFAGMGGITVGKENATDGNVASYLGLYTRPAAGSITERVRVDSAGNVGIGDASPAALLTVGNGDRFQVDSNGNVTWPNAATVTLANATNALNIDSNTLVVDALNNRVGIGTSSPAGPLHILTTGSFGMKVENTDATSYANLRVKGTGHEYALGVGGGSESAFGVANKFYIFDETAGAMRVAMDTSGNFGIGTTVPSARLTVADALASPTNNIFQVENANDSARYLTVSSTGTTVTNLTVTGTCTGCGGAGTTSLEQAYNAATSTTEITLNASKGGVTISDTAGSGIGGNLFEVVNSGAGNKYLAVSNSKALFNSAGAGGFSYGFGTSSPMYNFDLLDSASATEKVAIIRRGNQGAEGNLPTTYGHPYLEIGGDEYNANSLQTIGFGYVTGSGDYPDAEIGLLTTSTSSNQKGDLVFAARDVVTNTAPSERMRITSAGKVGIGGISPTTNFQVKTSDNTSTGIEGRITNTNTTTNSFAILSAEAGNGAVMSKLVSDSVGTGLLSTAGGYIGTTTSHPFGFITNNLEVARFLTTGSMLVGATTQSSSEFGKVIEIKGNNAAGTTYNNTGGTAGKWTVGADWQGANAFLSFYDETNSAYRMAINAAGNVGIGTNNAGSKLEIAGTTADQFMNGSTNSLLRFNTTGTGAPTFTTRSNGAKIVVYPALSASAADFGIGQFDVNSMWLGVPQNSASQSIKFYGGTSQIGMFEGDAKLAVGNVTPWLTLDAYASSPTSQVVQIRRGAQGSETSLPNAFGTPYLMIGGDEFRIDSVQTVGFGYKASATDIPAAEIGLLTTNTASNQYGDLIFGTRSVGTNTAASERVRILSTGEMGIGTSGITPNTGSNRTTTLPAMLTVAGPVTPTNTIFQVTNGNNSTRYMTVSSTSTLINPTGSASYDVGIGNNAPNVPLSIGTSSLFSPLTDVVASIERNGSGENSFLLVGTDNTANDAGIIFGTKTVGKDAAIFQDDSDSQKLKFATTDTAGTDAGRTAGTRMTIDQSGNIGIGTTGPLSKLDVGGGVAIGSYAGANAAPSNGIIVSGNVGIGNNNPESALHVTGSIDISPNSSSYNEGIRIHASTNDDYTAIALGAVSGSTGTGAGQWTFIRYPSAGFGNQFGLRYSTNGESNGHDFLNVSTAGNVSINNGNLGVGWYTPAARLVVADAAASPTNNIFQVTNGNDSTRYLTVNSTSTYIAGNLGIGTATPAKTLEVAGQQKITYNNGTVDSAHAALLIENPSLGQSIIDFTHGGTEKASIRSDSTGNLVTNTVSNYIYMQADYGSSTPYIIPGRGAIGFMLGITPSVGACTADQVLTVCGDASKSTGGTSWSVTSDARTKEDIQPFTDGLDVALRIDPRTFKYNGLGGTQYTGRTEYGVVAQELLPVAPYMIDTISGKLHPDDATNTEMYRLVNADAFPLIAINAIKELHAMIVASASGTDQFAIQADSIIDFKRSTVTGLASIISSSGNWSMTDDGYLVAKQVEAETVKAQTLEVVQTDQTQTVGNGTVPAGYDAVVIHNPAMTADSEVFLSFHGNPGSASWVAEKGAGDFTVHLSLPAPSDAEFAYWIIPLEDRRTPADASASSTDPTTDSGSSTSPVDSGSSTSPVDSGSGTTQTSP